MEDIERERGNIPLEFEGGDRVGEVGWSQWRREAVRQRRWLYR